MRNNSEIIRKIEELEKQLNELKLELSEGESEPRPIEVGDKVRILNPRAGQGSKGTVTKVNWPANRVVVEAKNTSGIKQKVVRAIQNVQREEG